MKIELNEIEIIEAIIEYVSDKGINTTDKQVDVTLVAGRGSNGHSANIALATRSTEGTVTKEPESVGDQDMTDPETDDEPDTFEVEEESASIPPTTELFAKQPVSD